MTKASWRLVRRDPTLVPLTLLAIGCFAVLFAAMIGSLADVGDSGSNSGARVLLFAIVGACASTFVLSFLCAAIAHAASAAFDGEPLTMREAIAEARLSLGPIVTWSLIAVAVTFGIQLLRFSGDGGQFLGSVAGLAWSFLVAYAIPIIALTGCGSGEAIGDSTDIARRRWAEQLSGGIAIFGLTVLAGLGWALLVGIGSSTVDSGQEAVGALFLIVGVLGLAFTVTFSLATVQTFTVALFRFDSGETSLEDLESPPPAEPIGGSPVLRIAGIVAGLLVMATLVSALLPHNRDRDHDLGVYTPENGYYYATFSPGSQVPLSAGSPVLYGGRQIGIVIGSRLAPSEVVVWFRADPALERVIEANTKQVENEGGYYYLQVGPPTSFDPLAGPPS